MTLLSTFSPAVRLDPGGFPRLERIESSAKRAKPILYGLVRLEQRRTGDSDGPGAPVSALADGDGIDALVDPPDPFLRSSQPRRCPSRYEGRTRR